MATATRAQSTTRTSQQQPSTIEVNLTPTQATALNNLRQARLDKKDAESREKAAKAVLLPVLDSQPKGVKLILKRGKTLLGQVSWRPRTDLDKDLLLEGWPEAYEAVKRESEYQVIS